MKSNPLLLKTITGFVGYWLLTPFIASDSLSIIISLTLMAVGTATLVRYLPDTIKIVFLRERYPDIIGKGRGGEGGYLAVFGTFLVSLGCIYAGVATLAWIYFLNEDPTWLSSPTFLFSRYSVAVGFAMLLWSPEVGTRSLRLSTAFWITVLITVIVGLLGLAIGYNAGQQQLNAMNEVRLTLSCPAQTPIKGNQSGLYHVPGERSYSRTSPEACFASPKEAQMAGYRPAR